MTKYGRGATNEHMATLDEITPPARDTGLLQWSVNDRGDEIDVALRGELDLAAAESLTDFLIDLALERPCKIICDLANVSFLDSTGIRALLSAASAASGANSIVVARHPTVAVLRVLEICGVAELLLDAPGGDAAEDR